MLDEERRVVFGTAGAFFQAGFGESLHGGEAFFHGALEMVADEAEGVGIVEIFIFPAERHENGKAVREDLQLEREGGAPVAVNIRAQFFAVGDGDAGFFHVDDGEELFAHLESGEEHRALPEEVEPVEIAKEGELDDAFIPVFRREEIAEAARGVGEHRREEGRGHADDRAAFRLDEEMVGFLPGQHLEAFHEVGEGAEEGLFLDGDLAHRFGDESGGDDIDEVAPVHAAHVDLRFFRRLKHADGAAGGAGNVEGPGEVIHRAEGDEAENGGAFHLHAPVDDFVDRAVAAHAEDVVMRSRRFPREICGVPRFFRRFHEDGGVALREHFFQQGKVAGRSLPA